MNAQVLTLMGLFFLGWTSATWGKPVNDYKQFELRQLNGQTTTVESLGSQKPLYIKFWASWCQPCMAQMPHFQTLHQKWSQQVDFVAVNIGINESDADVLRVQKQFGLSMPMVYDQSGALADHFNLLGTPLSVLLDANGQHVFESHQSDEPLEKALATLAMTKTQAQLPPLRAVLYTATWCDWYFEKTRPEYSQACVAANRLLNVLAGQFSDLDWKVVVSRLWTEDKDVMDFRKKYELNVPVAIDQTNAQFLDSGVKDYPTLIIFQGQSELGRIRQFDSKQHVLDTLSDLVGPVGNRR